ncbi:MAG: hypothetical protein N3I86_05500 [Verrucomicrobiae bacterium]|nr:hypothetical protein [Verrucomicrobiae bacterium]
MAVIADDFTGAAELGAIGRRHGLRAELVHFSALRELARTEVGLVCVDTDTRNCRPAVAAQRVAAVARVLRKRNVTHIYKKVDSVLRGPVRAEVEAIQRALGLRRVVLVPANPSAGRVVVGGRYLIQGTPLNETDFRHDPAHPRRTASVAELLGPRGRGLIEIRSPGANAGELPAVGIILGEAARVADLRWWARAVDGNTLPAGAAEFFGAWLRALGFRQGLRAGNGLPGGREVFVCGSASAATREFVEVAREAGVPVMIWSGDSEGRGAMGLGVRRLREAETALRQHERIVLALPGVAIGDRRCARRLMTRLVGLAAALIRRAEVTQIFVEGGETAAALAARLGWKRLQVVAEVGPGAVALAPLGDGSRVLVVKPGSYRWPAGVLRQRGCKAV